MSPYPAPHRGEVSTSQNATIDGTSKRLTIPANPCTLVVATVTGTWTDPDPEGDPTERAMIDIEFWKDAKRADVYPMKGDATFLLPTGTTHLVISPLGEMPPRTKVSLKLAPLPESASAGMMLALSAAGKRAASRVPRAQWRIRDDE